MPPPPPPEMEEPSEDWLVTYADAITLLMAFFVMLLNFSKIDIPMFEEVAAGIADKIGFEEKRESPIKTMKIELQYAVNEMQASEAIDVGTDDEGVVLELASSEFYKPGSAEIREEAFQILAEISRILQAPRYVTYTVEIEGHTDDDPISTTVYPSNWELSTGRATRVVRFFIDQGMNSRRLKAGGFAETRPKVDNRDAAGAPIPENQATNRRVVIRVYPSHGEDREFLRAITIDELSSEDSETRPINLLENPQR